MQAGDEELHRKRQYHHQHGSSHLHPIDVFLGNILLPKLLVVLRELLARQFKRALSELCQAVRAQHTDTRQLHDLICDHEGLSGAALHLAVVFEAEV